MATKGDVKWIFSFIVFSIYTSTTVSALRCVQCEDFSASSSTGILGSNPFQGRSNPGCATNSWATQTCSSGEYCGAVKATVTIKLPIVGSTTSEMIVRRCMSNPGVGLGCHSDDNLEGILGDVLSFLVKLGTVTVKGKLCLSDGTSICPNHSLFLYPWLTKDFVCVHWGIIGGGIAGVVLLLIGLCACCCCCCCKSSRPRGGTVHTAMVPQVMTIQTTNPAPANAPYMRMEEPGANTMKY